ncbi:TPA: LexA family transcriptional regulator [Serratia marcescens]|uniref:LexA family transcriptional regulator n=1 Tax=Serratia marcescens TaxID=615 RepID=UPI001A337B67|nr:LexA family transcriptional regulator [Serratia marcescens]HAU5717128.1 LexA family transcriptional regulator [Serratia marcescens]HAU5737704.1 LexA family transcriptional regulator [Serratia marcescens]HAU5742901.1 LexA family transcriptional regulator [Serratia marcescens]HAU5753614.1 LexA family transcriptional regulator [Serratia marcescens]
MGMMPKFSSPAADYVEKRLSLDEICISKPSATYFLRAAGQALAVGIHADAILIVAAEEGVHVLRRLRLYPYRALEFLDGSGRETELGNEDSEEGVEVFGVVMYCVNDMRSCEWDDLPVI